ncbi:MAG TPA: anthranilate synthase component I family protein, partial [Fibrobacteria bacterium]|nr:anthranilate synthase component I family protein [Fibrobacteria bacterium]
GEPLVTYMGSGARVLEAGREGVRAYSVLAPGPAPAFQPADPFAWLAGKLGGGVPRELPTGGGRAAGGFRGGLVGWLGYELKRHAGGGDLPGTPASDLPDALLLEPARMLVFDHAAGKARACLPETEGGPSDADRAWLASLPGRWPTLPELPPLALAAPAVPARPGLADIRLPFALSAPTGTYLASIRSLQEAIHRGESYEACLTNEVRVETVADPFLVYRVLRRANPSPYAAYVQFPQAAVLSASPERFLKLDAGGRLACRPIKGTRPRGRDAAEDAAIRAELAGNPKDRSENLMIVDLVRNDFGRVCALGTVEVRESLVVEAHPTVFQLVSGVEGSLRPGVSAPEAVRACFPGGSMTGAPKKRVMELLEALERRPRGIFSGALGWLGRDGAMDLGMVIRTLVRVPAEGSAGAGGRGEYRVGCGGAILAESCPEAELAEALLKAVAPLRALELAEHRESGGWTLRG